MEITVVVIDDEYTFADALAIRLNGEEDIRITAAAWPAVPSVGGQADLILLDADLAGSLKFCRATSGPSRAAQVIMLSYTSEPARMVAAIEAGARAWVRKDESIEHLLRVLPGCWPAWPREPAGIRSPNG